MLKAASHGFNGSEMFSFEVRAGHNKSVHLSAAVLSITVTEFKMGKNMEL